MNCRTACQQSPTPAPPVLEVIDSAVAYNPATGRIEQTVTLHEGKRIVLSYDKRGALRASLYLDAADQQSETEAKP